MPRRGATFPYVVLNGGVPWGASARFDKLFKLKPVTAARLGPLGEDGAKSTSHRKPNVAVNLVDIRQVSWAYAPRLWNSMFILTADCTTLKKGLPVSAEGTSRK